MTDDISYRLYLEEKFAGLAKHINAQFDNVHDTLDAIEKQTTKTNNRMTKLEDKVEKIEKDASAHLILCPQIEKINSNLGKIEKIKDDLEEYRFFKKYPKIFIGVISILVIGTVFSYWVLTHNIKSEVNTTKMELTKEIRTMDGISPVKRSVSGKQYVRINNHGITDTLYIK